jgi:hypothetical protein
MTIGERTRVEKMKGESTKGDINLGERICKKCWGYNLNEFGEFTPGEKMDGEMMAGPKIVGERIVGENTTGERMRDWLAELKINGNLREKKLINYYKKLINYLV